VQQCRQCINSADKREAMPETEGRKAGNKTLFFIHHKASRCDIESACANQET